jgi:hypothetical protein
VLGISDGTLDNHEKPFVIVPSLDRTGMFTLRFVFSSPVFFPGLSVPFADTLRKSPDERGDLSQQRLSISIPNTSIITRDASDGHLARMG